MEMQVVQEHLLRIEARGRVGSAPPEVARWLASLGLPDGLLRILTTTWPQARVDLVPFMLLSSLEIMNDSDASKLLEHRLLPIGFCPNGDPLVLDLATTGLVPGAVAHGQLWGGEPEDSDPRAYHRPLARDLADFFRRLAAGQHVPCDYWQAQQSEPSGDPDEPPAHRP